MPLILDIVIPLNESRPRVLPAEMEYFVDRQKYFLPILIHQTITFCIAMSSVLATESMFVTYCEHACGLFQIAGNQFEHAMDVMSQNVCNYDSYTTVYTNLIHGINIHRRAIEFSKRIWSTLGPFMIILIMIGVCSITVNLFRIYQATLLVDDAQEIIVCILFIATQFIYMFGGNYVAQRLIDHSSDVFFRVYCMPWYNAFYKFKIWVLIILERSVRQSEFCTPGIFTASLEGFASLSSICMTYFTMLYSVGEKME